MLVNPLLSERRVWKISPGSNGEGWEKCLETGFIGLGWDIGNSSELNNLKALDEKELKKYIKEDCGHGGKVPAQYVNLIYKVKANDIFIAYSAPSTIYGIGIVEDNVFYINESGEYYLAYCRKVRWDKKVSKIKISDKKIIQVLGQNTALIEVKKDFFVDSVLPLIPQFLDFLKENSLILMECISHLTLLSKKKQIILYGPPGTGKTHRTKLISVEHADNERIDISSSNPYEVYELYKHLKSQGQIEFITFHPSYSYEEFVEGITIEVDTSGRPTEELRYKLKQGIFKQIVIRAMKKAIDPYQDDEELKTTSLSLLMKKYRQEMEDITSGINNPEDKLKKIKEWWEDKPRFVLIIDEINRGDISKIFGELITLLEADKRLGMENELTAKLPYSQEEFGIPPNLFIIGTMNTADKSIALIDIALRRRFGFIEMSPDTNIIVREHIEKNQQILEENGVIDGLNKSIEALKKLNREIASDHSVGRDRQIGHSFLFKVYNQTDLIMVWKNEILPLLEEYYYGQYTQINQLLFGSEEDSKWISQMQGTSDFSDYSELIDFLNRVISYGQPD